MINYSRTPEEAREAILVQLHQHDMWDQELLGELFQYDIQRLHPRERLILELKCEGKSDAYIIKVLRRNSMQGSFTDATYETMKNKIKKKLRLKFNDEVQGWIKDISKKENENEETNGLSDSVDDDYVDERTSEES